MKRFTLPRTGVAAVVSVLSLALVTGCSDSGSDTGSDSGSGDRAGTKEPAAKVLGDGELEKLIIATADVKGFKVGPADGAEQFASSKKDIEVDDEKCAPLVYVLTGFAPGDEASYVNRLVQEDPAAKASASPSKALEDMTEEELDDAMNSITDALGSTMTIVSLSSYEGDGAEKAMSAVSTAIDGCAGGFTATAKGEPQKFKKIASEKASGNGDESLAFAATADAEGDPVVHAEVARHGNTVATYFTLSLAAFAGEGKVSDYEVPAALIKAQAAKLG